MIHTLKPYPKYKNSLSACDAQTGEPPGEKAAPLDEEETTEDDEVNNKAEGFYEEETHAR